jgi:hypothetical protein
MLILRVSLLWGAMRTLKISTKRTVGVGTLIN